MRPEEQRKKNKPPEPTNPQPQQTLDDALCTIHRYWVVPYLETRFQFVSHAFAVMDFSTDDYVRDKDGDLMLFATEKEGDDFLKTTSVEDVPFHDSEDPELYAHRLVAKRRAAEPQSAAERKSVSAVERAANLRDRIRTGTK